MVYDLGIELWSPALQVDSLPAIREAPDGWIDEINESLIYKQLHKLA